MVKYTYIFFIKEKCLGNQLLMIFTIANFFKLINNLQINGFSLLNRNKKKTILEMGKCQIRQLYYIYDGIPTSSISSLRARQKHRIIELEQREEKEAAAKEKKIFFEK